MNSWNRGRLIIWLLAPWMLLTGASMGQANRNKIEYVPSPYVSDKNGGDDVSASHLQTQKEYVSEVNPGDDSLTAAYGDENDTGILERVAETNDIRIHFAEAKNQSYELNLYGILGERISSALLDTGSRHLKFSIPGTFILPSAPYFVEMKDLQTGKSRIQKLYLN